MRRRTKRVLISIIALVVVVMGGTLIYARLIHQADDEFTNADVIERIEEIPDREPGVDDGPSVEGEWVITTGSEVGYRVDETINGIPVVANGRTTDVEGELGISGTEVVTATFTVDMTTVASDDSRRDNQFRQRIMNTAEFPTATFTLTTPIDFGAATNGSSNVQDGVSIEVQATGDLTLHGITRSVTFPLTATFQSGRIGVLGKIPVVFADYDIPNPSFATITTDDNGLLEFVLVLTAM